MKQVDKRHIPCLIVSENLTQEGWENVVASTLNIYYSHARIITGDTL